MVIKDILVKGKVQGVFFRAHTREEALKLGIVGTVRNLPDGSVQIHAEGRPEAMEAFLAWCAIGPSHARVDGLEVRDAEVLGCKDFTIVR